MWNHSRVPGDNCILPFIHLKCGNMAREGLRTLVVAKKVLSEEQFADFEVHS